VWCRVAGAGAGRAHLVCSLFEGCIVNASRPIFLLDRHLQRLRQLFIFRAQRRLQLLSADVAITVRVHRPEDVPQQLLVVIIHTEAHHRNRPSVEKVADHLLLLRMGDEFDPCKCEEIKPLISRNCLILPATSGTELFLSLQVLFYCLV
jgi:hypothetical protein